MQKYIHVLLLIIAFDQNGTCDYSTPESQTVYEGLVKFCQ